MADMLANPQEYLDRMTDRMADVTRWAMYGDRVYQNEDVVKHSFQTPFLGRMLLTLERSHGDASGIDGEVYLACCGTHDAGEGIGGDVRWTIKQHPILGPLLETAERGFFIREVIDPLPEAVRIPFLRAYDLQSDHESRMGRFFHATEVVGYLIRAVSEFLHPNGSRALALNVFAGQYESLIQYRGEFASVRIVSDPWLPMVDGALSSDEGRAEIAHVRERRSYAQHLSVEDVMVLLRALPIPTRAIVLEALQRVNGDGARGSGEARDAPPAIPPQVQ